ncbi:MAG: recombinase family protein [Methylococcaceae bacterium]
MNYCYLRVSTNAQDVENQKHGVMEYANSKGLSKLTIFKDSVSSKTNWKKRGIGELINERAKQGDVIVVSETSRLARTMLEILEISEAVAKLKIDLHLVKSGVVVDGTGQGKIMLALTGMFAEMERDLIRGRTKESLQKRKAEMEENEAKTGEKFFYRKEPDAEGNRVKVYGLGRPRGHAEHTKLDEKREIIVEMLAKKMNKSGIAKWIECSRSTLYDYLKRHKESLAKEVGEYLKEAEKKEAKKEAKK